MGRAAKHFCARPRLPTPTRLRQADQPVAPASRPNQRRWRRHFSRRLARRHAPAASRGALPGAVDRGRPPHVAQPQPAIHRHGHVGPGAWLVRAGVAGRVRSIQPSPSAPLSISSIASACASPLPMPSPRLGFEGEEAWRVAARIKVLLLTGAGVGKPQSTAPLRRAMRPLRLRRLKRIPQRLQTRL